MSRQSTTWVVVWWYNIILLAYWQNHRIFATIPRRIALQLQGLLYMQPASSQEALSALQSAQSASQDPNTILSGQRQQLGVDSAQQTVTGLRGAINNTTKLLQQVAPSVMGRTGSSLVTNAQATRQIGNEQAPINATLTEQGGQLSDADRTLNELNGKAQEAASGIYQGQQDKLSYAQNLYNTLYQKERDAEASRQAEADRQEQIRQFNSSQAAANRQFNYGVGQDSQNKADQQEAAANKALQANKAAALQDVKSVIGKSNMGSYVKAVARSAARGNELDKIKLELIKQLDPDAWNKFQQSQITVGKF